MKKEQWEKLQPLMDEALSLSDDARGPWLARVREESPTIAAELESLLAREGTLDRRGFLDTPLTLGRDVAAALSARAPAVELTRLRSALAGRYTIEDQVGQGGMALVYGAQDVRHGRRVAVKVIRPDASSALAAEQFLAEIRLTARLTHPNILPLLDSGAVEGALYYVMPFVEGESLRARMRREGPLPIQDTVRIVRAVAEALAYAHDHGTVHRDIKPDNVLLAGRQAWVADFGIAKAIASSATTRQTATNAGVAVGSPGYMAPEQIEGADRVDARADLYSLGVMAWEMLAGTPLFTGTSLQQMFLQHLTVEPPRIETVRTDVPAGLAHAVMGCLAKDPDRRTASASALLAQLDEMATVSAAHRPMAIVQSRRRWMATVTAAAVVIAGTWWAATRSDGEAASPRRVTDTGDVLAGFLSPDSRRFAYRRRTNADGLWIRSLSDTGAGRVLVPRLPNGTVGWIDDTTMIVSSPDSTRLVRATDGHVSAPAWLQKVPLRGGGAGVMFLSDTAASHATQLMLRRVTATGPGVSVAVPLDSGEVLDRIWTLRRESEFVALGIGADSALRLWRLSSSGQRALLRTVEPSDTTGLYRWLPRRRASPLGNPFVTPDGSYLTVATQNDSVLRVDLRRPDAAVLLVPTLVGPFGSAARDGSRLVRVPEFGGRLWKFPVTDDMETRGAVVEQLRGTVRLTALSPDGTLIAQVEGRPGERSTLSLRSLETGTTRRLLVSNDAIVVMYWSPDASKIALRLKRPGDSQRLAVLDVRDGSLLRLGRAPIRSASTLVDLGFPPAWSPDSRELFAQDFAHDHGVGNERFTGFIPDAIVRRYRLVEGDTGIAVHQHLTRRLPSGEPDTLWINGIVMSPDGSSLAVGGATITVIPLTGGRPRRVVEVDSTVTWMLPIVWREDGRIVYATRAASVGIAGNVFRTLSVASSGGPPRPAASLPPDCLSINLQRGIREATCFESQQWGDFWLVPGRAP